MRTTRLSPVLLTFALLGVLCAAARSSAAEAAISSEEIPPPLRPWVEWVLHGHEDASCPFLAGAPGRVGALSGGGAEESSSPAAAGARACLWPARLELELGDAGGRFAQEWQVFRDAWVPLPGDSRTWPLEVRVDGRTAPVAARGDVPSVRLTRGRHRVEGRFSWSALPPLLRVPPATGLLALAVRGGSVAFPTRDAEGRVWLQKRDGPGSEESRLDLTVHRLLDDDVPPLLTTRIELRVSGRSREARLGRALPDGFVPMSLTGPLPARLDADGALVVQVRPGTWTLELRARHQGPVSALELRPPDGSWPAEEVWVVQARPAIRVVTVEGAPALDPQQTTLPDEWRALPAYLMRPGNALRLEEKQRGDADPAPDRLTLERTLWLDFDGGGYTAHDQIGGQLLRSWRLEMVPPGVLGRVSIGGSDQLITRGAAAGSAAGVEVRQGVVDLQADSRLPGVRGTLPASGWDTDFQEVNADLRLPPGWRIAHASGVDAASTTWITSWNLLDLFLVLLTAMAVARLWGWRFLWIALGGLGLSWVEPNAPRWTWVAAIGAAALTQALPAGRLRSAARLLLVGAIAALLLLLVPFIATQARSALYPALEPPMVFGPVIGAGGVGESVLDEYESVAGNMARDRAPEPKVDSRGDLSMRAKSSVAQGTSEMSVSGFVANLAPDPKAAAQTGPGLPDWQWRRILLSWRGPVNRGQSLSLWLLPPWINFLLAWVRIGLLAALASIVLGSAARGGSLIGGPGSLTGLLRRTGTLAAISGLFLFAASPARAAEVPPQEALEALRARLLEPPDCLPDCLSFPQLMLEATSDTLRLRLELHAGASLAAPLPGGVDQWLPARAVLDGAPAPALERRPDGHLWIALAPGTHQVLLEGRLPDRATVPIALPLAPRHVTVRATGWRVEGLQEGGQAEGALQLTRVGPRTDRSEPAPQTLEPFVRIERQIEIGLRWEVRTQVTRLTPTGTAVLIEVPLLAGESVTSGDQAVVGQRAIVRLGPEASGTAWTSVLAIAPELKLSAPDAVPWVEVWKVAVSPVWHLEPSGIPPIHPGETPELRVREWRPWPGETLALAVTRPEAIEGRTLTFERSVLTVTPGLRSTDATLELLARSSRGGEHTLTLPEGAILNAVAIQGQPQPIRQQGARVNVPITPGEQTIRLEWREPRGISASFRVAAVQVGTETTNATTIVAAPADRWTLLLRGPRLGPAVLFWSLLVISLLAAMLLGAIRWTPLRWPHWFLLSFGLTQVPIWAALLIVAWLLGLGARRARPAAPAIWFDLGQLALALSTVTAIVLLFWAIEHGLLGLPEMQIAGNGSTHGQLNWYQDRTDGALPRPWMLSAPLLLYRLAMLAWALWLAAALVRWLRWGWDCFNQGGLWKALRLPRTPTPAPPPGGPAVPPPVPGSAG